MGPAVKGATCHRPPNPAGVACGMRHALPCPRPWS